MTSSGWEHSSGRFEQTAVYRQKMNGPLGKFAMVRATDITRISNTVVTPETRQRTWGTSGCRHGPAPATRDRETCQNLFSINSRKLPGRGSRRLLHRSDLGLISQRRDWAGSQHRYCRFLADKPVAVGLTDAGCGVFANTSARINKAHQEERKMSYLLEAPCSF